MSKIELTINTSYVPEWGVWEGLRELMQNALDGDRKGYEMKVDYSRGYLTITNENAVLPKSVLLLGTTTKRDDDDQAGLWGEGMKLGLLALKREGVDVHILNGMERWSPSFVHSKVFDAEVLAISTKKVLKKARYFTVKMSLDKDQWETYRDRFLALREDVTGVVKTTYGSLLNDPKLKGWIFSKGIFVTTRDNLDYGYDFENLKLDRDRSMPSDWDLHYQSSYIHRSALSDAVAEGGTAAGSMLRQVYDSAKLSNSKDLENLGSALQYEGVLKDKVAGEMADMFEFEYGTEAVPVETEEQAAKVAHFGKRGVVVGKQLTGILNHHYGEYAEMESKLRRVETDVVPVEDLSSDEQSRLLRAMKLVHSAVRSETFARFQSKVEVCSFADPEVQGTFVRDESGTHIRLARHLLVDFNDTLLVLVHEYAHEYGSDGSVHHGRQIEKLWSAITATLLARTGLEWLDIADDNTEVN